MATTVVARAGFWGPLTSSYSLIGDYSPRDRMLRRVMRRQSTLRNKTGRMLLQGLTELDGDTITAGTHYRVNANEGGTPREGGLLGGARTTAAFTDMSSFVAGTAADVTPLDTRLAGAAAPSTYPVGVQYPQRAKTV